VLASVDLLDRMQVSHNDSTLRFGIMDCVFLHGTDTTGISVYEGNLAQPVYAFLSVVIVNLLATILLEVVTDIVLEVVAVVYHHTAGRAIDNLV
jgi:hypothetical protein